MTNSNFIPNKDAEFMQWTNSFMKYLDASIRKFNFLEDVYGSLEELQADFAQKLEAATEPATRTALTVVAKNNARATLEKELRQAVKEYLTNNHLVTDEDRDGLGIPIRKTTRTPAPFDVV